MSSISDQPEDERYDRELYVDCVKWLQENKGLNLETKTKGKQLNQEEKRAFIKKAAEAVQAIIVKKWKNNRAIITPEVNTFRQMCRDGRFNVNEQRSLFREQARLYFKLSFDEQKQFEAEAKRKSSNEDDSSITNMRNSTNITNSINVNNDNVVVLSDEDNDDDEDSKDEAEEYDSEWVPDAIVTRLPTTHHKCHPYQYYYNN